jgi:hypothetical protein
MRSLTLAASLLALAGCGGKAAPPTVSVPATQTSTPTPTVVAVGAGPWSAPAEAPREPLVCPASSSRALWPDRVLALGGGKFVKLTGEVPQLADVAADGTVLGQTELGARATVWTRRLACGRDGRLAVAWVEERDESLYRLRVALRSADGTFGAAQTITSTRSPYDDPGVGDVALAFAPDGELLVAYSVFGAVRAALVLASGTLGRSVKLGPASEITQLAADISKRGRAIVAWSTYDGGEEQNVARRIYAATRAPGARRFAAAALVHRAGTLNDFAFLEPGVRLAVAANGRALLMWRTETGRFPRSHHPVMLAEATPRGRFGHLRRLAGDGIPGDVAIRSDGTVLAVWRGYGRLRAMYRGRTEIITGPGATDDPSASFTDGRPRVEWKGHSSVRSAP